MISIHVCIKDNLWVFIFPKVNRVYVAEPAKGNFYYCYYN